MDYGAITLTHQFTTGNIACQENGAKFFQLFLFIPNLTIYDKLELFK